MMTCRTKSPKHFLLELFGRLVLINFRKHLHVDLRWKILRSVGEIGKISLAHTS